jgi:hypothetical protein
MIVQIVPSIPADDFARLRAGVDGRIAHTQA